MLVAVDVLYDESIPQARAAGVGFLRWDQATPDQEEVRTFESFAGYQPGQFYLRELPCVLPLLEAFPDARCVVVDGYVDLGPGRPGLGRHLYDALGERAANLTVVGVAKTSFHGAPGREVFRGDSKRPLFVTSTGPIDEAAAWVKQMAGPHRMPTLLKRVDRLTRGD